MSIPGQHSFFSKENSFDNKSKKKTFFIKFFQKKKKKKKKKKEQANEYLIKIKVQNL